MRTLVLVIFLLLVTAGALLLFVPAERAARPPPPDADGAGPAGPAPALPTAATPLTSTPPAADAAVTGPARPESDCIDLTPFEERALAAEMQAWSGELGRARNRTNWPYQYYEDDILKRLADEGDAEAAFQLAMNLRWRFLYPEAGPSWNNDAVPESFSRDLGVDRDGSADSMELAGDAASYYMLAATGGYVFAIEEMGIMVDEIGTLLAEASEALAADSSEADRASRLQSIQASLADMRKASLALADVPYMMLPALARDSGLPSATDAEPSIEVVQMQNMLISAFHEMRAERGLPPFDESIPPGVSRYLARCP